MQTIVVDTDIAIDYLRGISYAKELMVSLWENSLAYLSILSVYELYAGMKETEKEDTENFINVCNIDFITYEIARKGGELYQTYRKKGITFTSVDCLIAATAVINRHKIATKNTEHYPDKNILVSHDNYY